MDEILLHPSTEQAITRSLASDNHAFALSGPYGSGKGYLAIKMAAILIGTRPSPQQVFRIDEDAKPISIDNIRRLQAFLRLKVAGTGKVRRVIIIENAQAMTLEAQNALLKTLEEPPADTRIIITTTDLNRLQPTVTSRVNAINVKPCSLAQLRNYITTKGYDYLDKDIEKAFLISNGCTALCLALLADDEHPLKEAIGEAKAFLTVSVYDRLLKVDRLSKDKEALYLFIFALQRVLQAAAKGKHPDLNSLAKSMRSVYLAQKELSSNANSKLLLTDLSLSL